MLRMDNPKKKKLDRKRIALGRRHERNYLKKITKNLLEKFQTNRKIERNLAGNNKSDFTLWDKDRSLRHMNSQSLIRCLKALQKYIERDKR